MQPPHPREPTRTHARAHTNAAQLGGFQEWPLLEDVDLVQRLKRQVSGPAILPLDIHTSGRYVVRWAARWAER